MFKSCFSLLVTLLAVLTAGSTLEIGMISSTITRYLRAKYTYFDGTKSKAVWLQEGNSLQLKFEAVVESGSLMLRVRDPEKEVIWEKHYPASTEEYCSSYSLEIPRTGIYRVEMEAEKSQGSFNLGWDFQ